MSYNYSNWKHSECRIIREAGVEGIMLNKTSDRRPAACYYVNLLFGEYTVYMQTIWDRRTRPEYEQTVVIPYRSFIKTINRKYLLPPTPPPLPLPPLILPQPMFQYPWQRDYPGLSPQQYQQMQNWKAYQAGMNQAPTEQAALLAQGQVLSDMLQRQMAMEKPFIDAARAQYLGMGGGGNCGCP